MNGKANLSGCTFTGNVTVPTLTATNVITGSETVSGNLTVNGTITAPTITANTSLTATTITSLGGIQTQTLTTSGNANVQGDVLYGLLATPLTSTMNGKANLSGCTFTGNVTVPTLTATNIITGSETENGNLSVGGTMTNTGSYGAWALAPIYGTSHANGNVNFTWGALTTSNNITHTANTDSFQVTQAGTYFIGCYVAPTSTATSGLMQMIGRYSTNGSTWSNVLVSTYPGTSVTANNSTLVLQGICTMALNSYFDVQMYNTAGTITLNATNPNSCFYMYRIG